MWNNITYVHPNENDNVKGFYYLVNRFIHDCPDGKLVEIVSGFINIAVKCELVNYTDSKLVMEDFYEEVYIHKKLQCSSNIFMEI